MLSSLFIFDNLIEYEYIDIQLHKMYVMYVCKSTSERQTLFIQSPDQKGTLVFKSNYPLSLHFIAPQMYRSKVFVVMEK